MSKIYEIKIRKQPQKFIKKQSPAQQKRILTAIYKLPEGDVKVIEGGEDNEYRLRVGDYRILYEIHDETITIIITRAGNRGDVYKKV